MSTPPSRPGRGRESGPRLLLRSVRQRTSRGSGPPGTQRSCGRRSRSVRGNGNPRRRAPDGTRPAPQILEKYGSVEEVPRRASRKRAYEAKDDLLDLRLLEKDPSRLQMPYRVLTVSRLTPEDVERLTRTRLRLLESLAAATEPLNVTELAARLGRGKRNVSDDVRILADVGLVRAIRRGVRSSSGRGKGDPDPTRGVKTRALFEQASNASSACVARPKWPRGFQASGAMGRLARGGTCTGEPRGSGDVARKPARRPSGVGVRGNGGGADGKPVKPHRDAARPGSAGREARGGPSLEVAPRRRSCACSTTTR